MIEMKFYVKQQEKLKFYPRNVNEKANFDLTRLMND